MTDPHTASPESPFRFREAFEATADERKALPENEVLALNIDVLTAVSTANAALPGIRSLRTAIEKTFVAFDLGQFDRLRTYGWALQHAQVLYVAATRPIEPVAELAARASALRETLLSDATALAHRGVLDGKRLAQLRGGVGYRNLAFDLQVLVAMLRERWSSIESKSMVQLTEIEQAEALGADLSDAVDGRERTSSTILAATSERARAFTLFYRAYDEARRAATFLRWHEGDAEELVPSLYTGRGGRGKAEADDSKPPPVAPSPAPAAPPVSPQPAAPAFPAGQPGGNPFVG